MSRVTAECSLSTLILDLFRSSQSLIVECFKMCHFQVDGNISHHDMFDYLSLTQKGYTKAFEPVNELLTTLLQEMEGEVGRTEAEGAAEA